MMPPKKQNIKFALNENSMNLNFKVIYELWQLSTFYSSVQNQ